VIDWEKIRANPIFAEAELKQKGNELLAFWPGLRDAKFKAWVQHELTHSIVRGPCNPNGDVILLGEEQGPGGYRIKLSGLW